MQLEIYTFQGFSVSAIPGGDCCTSIITAPGPGASCPPCQLVIPAVIRAVVQPEPVSPVPSVGNYAPALPPIIIENDNDNWQNLLYLLMFAKNNKRGWGGCGGGWNNGGGGYNGGCGGGWNNGGGGYNGGYNGGYGSNYGGFDGYSTPFQYNGGGYDYGSYPDDYSMPSSNSYPKEINLIIKTDSGTTCTCAK